MITNSDKHSEIETFVSLIQCKLQRQKKGESYWIDLNFFGSSQFAHNIIRFFHVLGQINLHFISKQKIIFWDAFIFQTTIETLKTVKILKCYRLLSLLLSLIRSGYILITSLYQSFSLVFDSLINIKMKNVSCWKLEWASSLTFSQTKCTAEERNFSAIEIQMSCNARLTLARMI